jgi:hypothetical protein
MYSRYAVGYDAHRQDIGTTNTVLDVGHNKLIYSILA